MIITSRESLIENLSEYGVVQRKLVVAYFESEQPRYAHDECLFSAHLGDGVLEYLVNRFDDPLYWFLHGLLSQSSNAWHFANFLSNVRFTSIYVEGCDKIAIDILGFRDHADRVRYMDKAMGVFRFLAFLGDPVPGTALAKFRAHSYGLIEARILEWL